MKEVACVVLDPLFSELEKRNLAPEIICSGVPYALNYLRDKHERIEWGVFCKIMANASAIWSLEEFEKIGSSVLNTRLGRFAATIGALLFTTTEFYSWYNSPSKSGGGRQYTTCIIPTQTIIAKNHIRLILEIEQGYEDCPEFFHVAKGGMALPPVVFGLSPAIVEMKRIERGAVYDIHYTEGRGALVWLRKIVTWPFNARIAAYELKESNEVLLDRYFQLELTKERVQEQAAELVAAYKAREVMQWGFSKKQIEQQEAERKRLASELHDGLGQDLLIVNNEIQQFLNNPNSSRVDLQRMSTLMQESIESVREISSNLHPHHIERLGFCAAVEAMVDKLSHSSAIDIQYSYDQIDPMLPKDSEIHLYRIIQESLSNVVKHSGATSAHVEIRKKTGFLEVTIHDNGEGFDVAASPPSTAAQGVRTEITRGFGIASMSERARIVGGELDIKSTPQRGTTVHLTVPIPE